MPFEASLGPSCVLSVCCFFVGLNVLLDFFWADDEMLRALLERTDFLILLLAELGLSESESELTNSAELESEAWWPSVSCSFSKLLS